MDKDARYTFVVDKSANKIEIKKAVETKYNVNVAAVNTLRVPSKTKNTFRNGRFTEGRKSGFKKAIITLAVGEFIDIYGSGE